MQNPRRVTAARACPPPPSRRLNYYQLCPHTSRSVRRQKRRSKGIPLPPVSRLLTGRMELLNPIQRRTSSGNRIIARGNDRGDTPAAVSRPFTFT
ncbi:hypothetical protein EVAR_47894_1 [Eumeta japonica]|uniref:Uncharacterized protein n=1 Tax=Eumeta variegata TaxID=151549 RepID=A0A4C1Y7R3_EUMVA|nr:hypothetical protein EVAR_47894_1 [Eumeta japonica]